MSLKVNTKHLSGFVKEHELKALQSQVQTAHDMLEAKTGLGNDFLGWVTLPTDYDQEEFARIQKAAQKI